MYKSFSLAIVALWSLIPQSFALVDDTAIIDREEQNTREFTLQKFTSCEAMDTVMKDYLRRTLRNQSYEYGGGTGGIVPMPVEGDITPVSSATVSAKVDAVSPTSTSQTNVQVVGIDEADVVKNDGRYIYFASNIPDSDGRQYVTITDTHAGQLTLLKRIALPNSYSNIQLYLSSGKLVILAHKWTQNSLTYDRFITIGNGSSTVVAVYDLTDVAHPQLDRLYTVAGDLSQSRREGDTLYVLSQNSFSFNYWGTVGLYTKGDIDTSIDTLDTSALIPRSVEMYRSPLKPVGYTRVKSKTPCTDIEYILPKEPQNLSFLTLSVIDLGTPTKPTTKKVIYGDASQIFMSRDSLYIVGNYWKQNGGSECPPNARCIMPFFAGEQNSLIHRFSIKKSTVQYQYSTIVPGIPLSQYAMNEKDGVFFIANQKDWSTNGVDVFAINRDGTLLSKLQNVGEKERFQSARYIGNRLYLVTFQQIDPLFVIDTTNPKNMKIMGELLMPGYSTYLHPYDDNHLIGIGYDTQTNTWGGTQNSGIKVDLYDVADVSAPKQKYSKVFGGIGSSSDALWNPRALIWDSARHNLLLPAQLMDQDMNTYQYKSGAQGLLVVNIDASKGIHKETLISHIDTTDMLKKRDVECANYSAKQSVEQCYTLRTTGEKVCTRPSEINPIPLYCYNESDDSAYLANQMWNFSSDFVQRGLFIGDTLFTVSAHHIQSNSYGNGYGVLKSIAHR